MLYLLTLPLPETGRAAVHPSAGFRMTWRPELMWPCLTVDSGLEGIGKTAE